MTFDEVSRRHFLRIAGTLAGAGMVQPAFGHSLWTADPAPADYTLHIAASPIEISPKHILSTITYNGQFPGPLLRFREGQPTTVDIFNDTDTPEQLHWHGQFVSDDVDGASEEGTPPVPARGMRRITFTPGPAGFRFYHTHHFAGANLQAGQYTGQVGPVYIEPKHEPGDHDLEVFLVLKEFEPSLSRGGDMAMNFLAPVTPDKKLENTGESSMKASLASGMPHGYEVGYQYFTINGRMLGHGEPIRVKFGQRILFHVLNGSATEIRSLALPGHTFKVVALDGNPVPTAVEVPLLWLGTAERVSAVVEMKHPGVWVMGDLDDDDRSHGMGIVVEYAGHTGKPQWAKPEPFRWDYTRFGQHASADEKFDEQFELIFAKNNAAESGFNQWTINGVAFSTEKPRPMFHLRRGGRYRLRMRNASDDIHPIHLHRHSFELLNTSGRPAGGVYKDVVMVGGYQEVVVAFTADNPGLTLFHCHQQLHMDFGFMALFDYV